MRPKLSKEAQRRVDLAGEMMAKALKSGAVPEIIIAAKAGNEKLYQVDYHIVSPLPKEQIRYVLSRVLGLLDGSIAEGN